MKIIRAINKNKTKYKLKNLIKNKTKKTKPNKQSEFLDLSNIESGSFFKKKDKSVPEDTKSDLLVVEKGNIVYGKCRPNLDKAIIAEKDAVTTGESLVYETFCAEFILSLMHSKNFINYNVHNALGAKMPRTSNKNVLDYEFVTLEDIDFEKTGNFLFENQLRIRNIKKLIEKLEKRNQYYAERLLSGELRVREDEEGSIEFYENEEWKEIKIQSRKFKVPKNYNCTILKDCEFISLTRGSVLSKKDINKNPGNYPIYSSSIKNNGLMGFYGDFSFNEEMITWSVDGGGNLFYREKHKFNVTNVSGIMRLLDNENFSLKYIYYLFKEQHKKYNFDYSNKAHPSIIENLYYFTGINKDEQNSIVKVLEKLDKEKHKIQKLLEKEQKRFEWLSDALLSGEYQIVD